MTPTPPRFSLGYAGLVEFYANPGQSVEIDVDGVTYLRHTIATGLAKVGDSYTGLIEQFVVPCFQPGDLLFSASKVLSICSGNVIDPDTMKVGWWAKTLAGKVSYDINTGMGVAVPLKMQYAIDTCGLPRILLAAAASVIGKKIFRKKGWFYVVTGPGVAGIDGFGDGGYHADGTFTVPMNGMYGIPLPDNAQQMADAVYEQYGIPLIVTDTNDFDSRVLAITTAIRQTHSLATLKAMIRDNPFGQGNECTPFVLVRKAA